MKRILGFVGCSPVMVVAISLIAGCRKNQSDSPSTPTAAPPAAAVTAASSVAPAAGADVTGVWKATKLQDKTGKFLSGGIFDDLLSARTEIRPDHTFGTTNTAMGHGFGTWVQSGNSVTLTMAPPRNGTPTVLTLEGDHLVDHSENFVTTYDKLGPGVTDTTPKFSLTASQFQDQVTHGFAAAQKKYADSRIELTGVVTMIQNSAIDVAILVDGPPAAGASPAAITFGGVRCQPLDPEPWATVCVGQPVKVTGIATLMNNAAEIDEATFTPVGPSLLIPITADDLATEYAKDADGTQKKYSSEGYRKSLIITGVVLEKHIESGKPSTLVLGKPGAVVYCSYSNDGADTAKILAPIQVGQTVKLVGEFNKYGDKLPELWNCNLITKHGK